MQEVGSINLFFVQKNLPRVVFEGDNYELSVQIINLDRHIV